MRNSISLTMCGSPQRNKEFIQSAAAGATEKKKNPLGTCLKCEIILILLLLTCIILYYAYQHNRSVQEQAELSVHGPPKWEQWSRWVCSWFSRTLETGPLDDHELCATILSCGHKHKSVLPPILVLLVYNHQLNQEWMKESKMNQLLHEGNITTPSQSYVKHFKDSAL